MTKKERIKKAAIRLFVERGFHDTPTALIAKESEVSNGTLFHYYKNKDELISSMFLEIKKDMMESLRSKIDENYDLLNLLKESWYNGISWGILHSNEFKFIFQYIFTPFFTEELKNRIKDEYEHLDWILNQTIRNNLIKTSDLILVRDYFESAMNSTIIFFQNNPNQISENKIYELFEYYFFGIKKQ